MLSLINSWGLLTLFPVLSILWLKPKAAHLRKADATIIKCVNFINLVFFILTLR